VIDTPDSKLADVTFLVGGEQFGGLRRVLALRCAVLEQMLLGCFAEAREEHSPIRLAEFDSTPRAFRQFLFYLHVGRCSLDNVSDVVGLYEVSEYFGVTELHEVCAEYLDKVEITDGISVELCNFASRHGMSSLLERVVNYIAEHADTALANAARSALLPPSLLRYIFQSSDIAVSEVTLFRILLEMSAAQQQPLLPLIRLPRISALDMMKTVVPSGLFDSNACLAALAFRENPHSVDLPEESKAPRAQSSRASSCKLPSRRGPKIVRDSGPWGREYLRFARAGGCTPGLENGLMDDSAEGGEAVETEPSLEESDEPAVAMAGCEMEPSLEEVDEPAPALAGPPCGQRAGGFASWAVPAEREGGHQPCCAEAPAPPAAAENLLERAWCSTSTADWQ